jgi:hypothetical protein
MNAQGRDRVGATRGKLAVVGVLAVVFVGVLASNFRTAADEPIAAALPAEQPGAIALPALAAVERPANGSQLQPEAKAMQARAATPFGEFAEDGDWPEYSLDKLVSFDPFGTPTWLAAPEPAAEATAEAVSQSLQEFQEAQNAIILVSGDQRVARIGSQEYRVGDMVGPYQITEISSAGIVLSEPAAGSRDAK